MHFFISSSPFVTLQTCAQTRPLTPSAVVLLLLSGNCVTLGEQCPSGIKCRKDVRQENKVVKMLLPALSWQREVGADTYTAESDFYQNPPTRQPSLVLQQLLKSSELLLCPEEGQAKVQLKASMNHAVITETWRSGGRGLEFKRRNSSPGYDNSLAVMPVIHQRAGVVLLKARVIFIQNCIWEYFTQSRASLTRCNIEGKLLTFSQPNTSARSNG